MKVLAFAPLYLPFVGGIEIFLAALAQCFREQSIETVVVTDADGGGRLPARELLNEAVVYRLPFRDAIRASDATTPLSVLQRLVGILEAEKPDLVHVHSAVQWGAWYLDRLLGKLSPKLPLVVTQHGLLAPADRIAVVRSILLRADVLTAVSEAALRSAIEFSGRVGPSTVIYNGIRVSSAIDGHDRDDGKFDLMCIGRLEHGKGFDVAVAALAKVRAAGLDAELKIVGRGEELGSLQELAARHGVSGHMHWAGVLDHARALEALAGASLALVPARMREGFSLVAAEAAMLGVPCVASRMGGLPEVVDDGVTGVLVEPEDPDALALAIVGLLKDEPRRRTMGARARRRALEMFDMDRCVEGYLKLYRDLRVLDA